MDAVLYKTVDAVQKTRTAVFWGGSEGRHGGAGGVGRGAVGGCGEAGVVDDVFNHGRGPHAGKGFQR